METTDNPTFADLEDPQGYATDLWERYHATKDKKERKILKAQYNQLAEEINNFYKRKDLLLIH